MDPNIYIFIPEKKFQHFHIVLMILFFLHSCGTYIFMNNYGVSHFELHFIFPPTIGVFAFKKKINHFPPFFVAIGHFATTLSFVASYDIFVPFVSPHRGIKTIVAVDNTPLRLPHVEYAKQAAIIRVP